MATRATGLDIILRMKDQASRGVQAALRRINTAVKRTVDWVFSLKGALAGLGATLLARSFLNTAASFEQLELQLETVTGSAESAREGFAWIREFTRTTPYELEQVSEAFVRLKAYGIDPMPGTLRTLGDTASAMTKPLMSAVEALADAVQGENERLKEFGIKARVSGDQVAYTWSDAMGRTRTTIARNTPEIIRETLLAIWNEKYAGGMEKQAGSWRGMLSNLWDYVTEFKNKVMESGPFQVLKAGLAEVLETIGELDRNGTLEAWAYRAGQAVVGAFRVMASGVEMFVKSLNVAIGSFQSLAARYYEWRLDWARAGYQQATATAQNGGGAPWTGDLGAWRDWFRGGGGDTEVAKQMQEDLGRQIPALEDALEAWQGAAQGSAENFLEIDAAFGRLNATLDRLVASVSAPAGLDDLWGPFDSGGGGGNKRGIDPEKVKQALYAYSKGAADSYKDEFAGVMAAMRAEAAAPPAPRGVMAKWFQDLAASYQDEFAGVVDRMREEAASVPSPERFGAARGYFEDLAASYQGEFDGVMEQMARVEQRQSEWVEGAKDAFADYQRTALDTYANVNQAAANSLRSFEDALVNTLAHGKLSFRDFADSVIADLARIFVRQQITGPLAQSLSGLFGPSSSPAPADNYPAGDAYMPGAEYQGVRYAPRTAGRTAAAAPTGGGVEIHVHNAPTGTEVKATSRTTPDGRQVIDLVLQSVAADVRGGGRVAQAIAGTYGLRRVPGAA